VGLDSSIYSREEILANPKNFAEVELLFSTWGMPAFRKEEIEAVFPNLKALFYAAGSVQSFARPFLESGVRVFSAWAANAVPVAEYTVAEIILSNKGYFLTNRLYHTQGRKASQAAFKKCPGNYGETVGIIGAGMIGRLVIQMLKAYHLKVIVFDPFLPDEKALAFGVEKCELSELFERAFVVSNHLANNPQTVGMLNYDLFKLMKPNATFLNTGRGAQVIEADLARAMSEKPDACSILDVTYPEPIQDGNPLLELENVYLTPHIAGSQADEVHRMAEYMIDEFKCFEQGLPTKYEVSEKMLETMA
jgi:phosphoglycerate dehydrogenase-like enzyme